MIQVSTVQAVRGIQHLVDKLSVAQMAKAESNAINHTLGVARTRSARAIREEYNIPYAEAIKATKIQRSSPNRPVGLVMASSGRTSLAAFAPRIVSGAGRATTLKKGILSSKVKASRLKPGQRTGVLEVEIKKGKRMHIASAFFMPKAGISAVMARGSHTSNSDFRFRHKRVKSGSDTPIDALKTVSVFKALTVPRAQYKLRVELGERYQKRLIHEIERLLP
jgi:hypothetical protein